MKHTSLMSTRGTGSGVLPRRSVMDEQFLKPTDPAIQAITDFTRDHPATVEDERQIDDALTDMVRVGVRALLVVRDQRVVGLITSYDIQGERPLQFLQHSTYTHHHELRVAHIMTPWDKLLVVDWDALQHLRAGELLRMFDDSATTHMLVVQTDMKQGTPIVRGLASRARLTRQLSGRQGAAA
jgi:CBS-domain-containing membrane protein